MATIYKKVGNILEITKTSDSEIFTISRKEIISKIAEAQTKIDHLNINVIEAKNEKTEWNDMLKEIDKA